VVFDTLKPLVERGPLGFTKLVEMKPADDLVFSFCLFFVLALFGLEKIHYHSKLLPWLLGNIFH